MAELLPDDAQIYPTHGFGSFCSSGGASGAGASTIGQERAVNDALVGLSRGALGGGGSILTVSAGRGPSPVIGRPASAQASMRVDVGDVVAGRGELGHGRGRALA